MPTLSLTKTASNGLAHDASHVNTPLTEVETWANTTKLDYLNIQDNGLRVSGLRTHANVEGVRIKVRNATGSSIAANSLVYFSGTYSDGSNNYPTITKAISTTAVGSTYFAQAVTSATIADGADGTAAIFMELSSQNTSSGTVGDLVYLDTTAGGWTRTRPTGGQYIQVVGTITVVHASTGRIVLSLGAVPEHLTGGSSGLGATFQTLTVQGASGAAADIYHFGDAGEDNADKWKISVADGGVMTWENYTSGSYVAKMTLDSSGNATVPGELDAGTLAVTSDITVYDDQNNADVSLSMGTGAAEALVVQALNGGSNKTLEELRFTTKTASGTGDHGKMSFYVDEAEIATIDDGGIDLASGKAFTVNGSALSSGISWDGSTANGVATYKDGDEATVESTLTFATPVLTVGASATAEVRLLGSGDNSVKGLSIYSGASSAERYDLGLNWGGGMVEYDAQTGMGHAFQCNSTTKVMLTSGGNLGIGTGTTAPAGVGGTIVDVKGSGTNGASLSMGTTTAVSNARLSSISAYSGTTECVRIETGTEGGVSDAGAISFDTKVASGALTRRMTINSTGDVGIGTTSPSNNRLAVVNSTSQNVVRIDNTNSSPYGLQINFSTDTDNNSNHFFIANGAGTAKTRIYSDGDVWTSDAGTLTSDERLKTNIVDASDKLADVMRLKIRNFEWTAEYHPNKVGEKKIGFIAQELETVFPSLVTDHDIAADNSIDEQLYTAEDDTQYYVDSDELPDGKQVGDVKTESQIPDGKAIGDIKVAAKAHEPTMRKSYKNAFTPILVKALQEVTVRLEAAEAKIAALEAA